MSFFFTTLLQQSTALAIFILLGTLLLYTTKRILSFKNIYSLFTASWLGSVLFTSLVAIFFTKGITIMLLPIVTTFVLVFFLNKKDFDYSSKLKTPIIIFFTFTFVIVSFYYHSLYFITEINQYFISDNVDHTFYAKVSRFVKEKGIEDYNINYINYKKSVSLYHYFDLWQNVGLSECFHNNYLKNLYLVLYPVNYLMVFLGVLSLFEKVYVKFYKEVNFKKYYLGVLLLIFLSGPFYLPIMKNYVSQTDIIGLNIHNLTKLFPVYIMTITWIISIMDKNFSLFFFSSLIGSVNYPVIFPTILVLLFLILVLDYNLFFIKIQNIKHWFVALILFFLLYYLYFGLNNQFANFNRSEEIIQGNGLILNFSHIFQMIKIFLGSIPIVIFIYLPFFLFLFKNFYYHYLFSNIIFLNFVVFILSLSIWAVLNHILNTSQIFYSSITPLLHSSLFLWLIFMILYFIKNNYTSKIMLILFIVSCSAFFNHYPKINHFFNLNNIKNKVKDSYNLLENKISQLNPNGVFFYSPNYYLRIKKNPILKAFTVYQPGHYLINFNDRIHSYNLSIFEVKLDSTSKFFKNDLKFSMTDPFYYFVNQQKKSGEFHSIEQAQYDFIKQYHIEWAIVYDDATLPPKIYSLVVDSMQVPSFKEKIYFLNSK